MHGSLGRGWKRGLLLPRQSFTRQVFFKTTKSFLNLAKEFQGRSYDSMVAHTTIVFCRYIMLALENRESKDPKTLGNLFYLCCDELQDISFAEAFQLILTILKNTVRKYIKPNLLIIDDFGLREFSSLQAEDLYELICERYRNGSLIVSSNRAPGDWYSLFPNPVLAEGALDRLINSSHHLLLTGKSYRPLRRPGQSHHQMSYIEGDNGATLQQES